MKTLGIIAAILVVVVVGAVAAYKISYAYRYPVYSHRYRLTLEVETPNGLKTASGVIEPLRITQPRILTDRGSRGGLRGDAVFLDLGDGKNVTALLASGRNGSNVDAPITLAIAAFKIPSCKTSFCQWKAIAGAKGARDLPPSLIPTLVTFGDVVDPKTARTIQPGEFEAVFGPGYRFKRAWIEMTDDSVTRQIRKSIPWADNYEAEMTFERRLREVGGRAGGSLLPGMNLSRD